ncbi:MAG: MreC domain-containing protein, partial [Planctomycetota bacterium]|jgi:predicted nuclease with TOPRIM domain
VNPKRGESIVRHLQEEYQELMGYVSGNPTLSYQSLESQFQNYGVGEDGTVRDALQKLNSDLNGRENELDARTSELATARTEINDLDSDIERLKETHQEELDAVTGKIAAYEKAAEDYRTELHKVKGEYYSAIDRLRERYEGDIARLENEKDALFQDRVVLKSRLDELQEILSVSRLQAQDPSTLVDGRIVDTIGGSDEVYIDRGKQDRIVLGMTFEVYDDESALQEIDRLTGEMPRGKASLQVVQVRETTSKCMITRAIPGRPVVRTDVIANAVYDPNYVFKFMVHGKFDVDGDGKPSEAEAEYLRSLIVSWGGEVVQGEMLPGDLDFLVLGMEPPLPADLRPNATEFQIDDWVRKRRAYERYHELFHQASEAQIPVLNANRFFVLIGYTER